MSSFIGCYHFDSSGNEEFNSFRSRNKSSVYREWLSSDNRCWLAITQIENTTIPIDSLEFTSSSCGRFHICFIGDIHNHLEIRRGLRFENWLGLDPAETIAEGLAQRGPALLLEMRGSFSFAAYDKDKQQLLLSRDRFGIKPLYFFWKKNILLFSTDRQKLSLGKTLARQSICNILSFGHDFAPVDFPKSFSSSISALPSGMVVRFNHSRPHDSVRYWPPQPRPDWSPLPIYRKNWAHTFLRQKIEEVVDQNLCMNSPVACLLSNDIYSYILTAVASCLKKGSVSSFSIYLQDESYNQGQQYSSLASYCGSSHHNLSISTDEALSWVEPALTSMDVPNVHFFHKYFLSRSLADQSVEIALSGLGADSLFGLSPQHRNVSILMAMQWIPEPLRRALIHIASPLLAKIISTSPKWDCEYLGLAMRRLTHDENFHPVDFPLTNWPLSPPNCITQKWGQISWVDLFGYSLPTFLIDSISTPFCNRLEWRFPFFDHQLAEITLRMPQRFHGNGNKLLRNAFKDLFLTSSLLNSTNHISLPMSIWTRGPLRQLCSTRLEILKTTGIVDSSFIEQIWRAFELRQISWRCIWSLVILGELARREFN